MLHSVSAGSGANVHVREFIHAMRRLGVEADVVGTGLPPTTLRGRRRRVPVPQRMKDLVYLAQNLGNRRIAERAARRFAPDVLYVRGGPYMAYGAQVARSLSLPMYYEINSPFPEEHLRFHGGGFAALGRRIERRQRATARAIFVVSHELRELLMQDGVPPDKVEVVRNGVDLSRFDPTPRADDGVVRMGFVGSLQAWHGIAELIDVAERVLPAAPHARLELAGDGPMADWLRARLACSPVASSILWRGRIAIDEVPAFLQRMDILLAPYPAVEGFYFSPLKVFEYLAAGRPVVASRIGQIRELVQDGSSGLLVAPGDVQATAQACLRLIGDPRLRRALGAGARAAAEPHTWDANARAVLGRVVATMSEARR